MLVDAVQCGRHLFVHFSIPSVTNTDRWIAVILVIPSEDFSPSRGTFFRSDDGRRSVLPPAERSWTNRLRRAPRPTGPYCPKYLPDKAWSRAALRSKLDSSVAGKR